MTGIRAGTSGAAPAVPAGIFDPLPMAFRDGRYLGQDNVPWHISEGAVSLLSNLLIVGTMAGFSGAGRGADLKEAERITFQDLGVRIPAAYGTASPADAYEAAISCRYGGDFDDASADGACKLVAYALNAGGLSRNGHPSRIRADDRTCGNIRTMVRRTVGFLESIGPVDRIGFDISSGGGGRITEGYGNYLVGDTIWDMAASTEPLPKDAVLRLVTRYVMCIRSGDPGLRKVRNMGILNPRLGCAYITGASRIGEELLGRVEDLLGPRPRAYL